MSLGEMGLLMSPYSYFQTMATKGLFGCPNRPLREITSVQMKKDEK